jgi:hypothetical protein
VVSASGQTEAGSGDTKLGIKTAINLSTFTGSELTNPRLRFGYSAGAYYRTRINKNLHFQTEFLGNFKGSNFNNDLDEYSRIATFYLDLPLMIGYELSDNQLIMIGPQLGYLALSSMYIGSKAKAHINDLALHPFALDGIISYQVNGKIVGFQAGLKLGVFDLNNGLNFEQINPPTGNGGSIRSLSFELGLLF